MPLLSVRDAMDLLRLARIHGVCSACGHRTAMDYCRSCNEFYWIHSPRGCRRAKPQHHGHRLTIVPFVEVK
jgi:hypothetical protein